MSSSFIGKVLDNYRILERLGVGGMGVVFKAIHIKLDKIVAVKIISPGLSLNENFIRRFESEAKALAKFEDPNIVRIYDLRSTNDQWFIVMEFVEGQTLSDLIEKYGRFPWRKAMLLFKQMLSGIAHAHEAGIIHRDIKPNNIMLTHAGSVKITDFGLAKDQTNAAHTVTVSSGGTLFYMSPEHVKGFSFIDARSDIYSLGMTFYEMITGTVPFKDLESDFDIREAIVRKKFDKPSQIDPEIPSFLDKIIMKAIRKDPDTRFQSADDMLKALDEEHLDTDAEFEKGKEKEIISEAPGRKKKPMTARPQPAKSKQTKKRLPLRTLAAAALLIILAIVGYQFYPKIINQTNNIPDQALPSVISITTTPDNAELSINGKNAGKTPLQNHSLPAGLYNVQIIKNKFIPLDTIISVGSDANLRFSFVLETLEIDHKSDAIVEVTAEPKREIKNKTETPRFASLHVKAEPPNSEIWLAGRYQGQAPLYIDDLKPGTYIAEVRKEGYQTYVQRVTLKAGNNQSISAELNLNAGEILINKNPTSAQVYIDNQKIESKNASSQHLKNIPVGEHQIEISSPGYSRFSKNVLVKKDETVQVDAELMRLEGELSIQIRPWGSIYIDDQLQKKSSDIKHQVKLPAREHDIRVEHPTLGQWERPVMVTENQTTKLVINFTKKIPIDFSAVDRSGNPLDADIFVDDEGIGQMTPASVRIRTGIHRIAVKKAGYQMVGGAIDLCVDEQTRSPIQLILEKANE